MSHKTLIKNSLPSVLDVTYLHNLVVQLDAPAEELVSGGRRPIIIFASSTFNPKTASGDVTPIEEIGVVGAR